MTLFQEPAELPEGFAGIVRVFPLPNLVMFPHVVQALHVFEPRYRELLDDALAGDQLISIALLQPGWEPDYESRPPIYPEICIGRVIAHVRLQDGRYNILLHGLKRASVIRELPPEHAFRLAEVAVVEDVYFAEGAIRRSHIQQELLRVFQRYLPDVPTSQEQFERLLSHSLPLGTLTDIIASTVPFDLAFKQMLLSERNVDRRAEQLLARLQTTVEQPIAERGDRAFPPDFSSN